jgi:hypothetical protein
MCAFESQCDPSVAVGIVVQASLQQTKVCTVFIPDKHTTVHTSDILNAHASGCSVQGTKAKDLHYELTPFLCNNTTLFVKVCAQVRLSIPWTMSGDGCTRALGSQTCVPHARRYVACPFVCHGIKAISSAGAGLWHNQPMVCRASEMISRIKRHFSSCQRFRTWCSKECAATSASSFCVAGAMGPSELSIHHC